MGEVLRFPAGSKIRSMVTQPLRWVAMDTESYYDELTGRYHVYEISFRDIYNSDFSFTTKLSMPNPQYLNDCVKRMAIQKNHLLIGLPCRKLHPHLGLHLVLVSWLRGT